MSLTPHKSENRKPRRICEPFGPKSATLKPQKSMMLKLQTKASPQHSKIYKALDRHKKYEPESPENSTLRPKKYQAGGQKIYKHWKPKSRNPKVQKLKKTNLQNPSEIKTMPFLVDVFQRNFLFLGGFT